MASVQVLVVVLLVALLIVKQVAVFGELEQHQSLAQVLDVVIVPLSITALALFVAAAVTAIA